jgi:hypothetical protein
MNENLRAEVSVSGHQTGGLFADRVVGEWLASTGQDPTANVNRPVPEQLLRHHDLPEAGLAAGAMVMAGEVVEG